MTRFADQLFDDLMREHGTALTHMSVTTAPKRHRATRPVLLTAGVGGVAVAATVGSLVAGGATPAYAVTTHPDGTVTLAVYQQSGIAGANSQLHRLGDERVVVVPVGSNCPSITSLPAPKVQPGKISVQSSASADGAVTVDAHGVPRGDILVVGFESSANGHRTANGHVARTSFGASRLTSGPAPSCVSVPAPPGGGHSGGGKVSGGSGSASTSQESGGGSGPATNSNS